MSPTRVPVPLAAPHGPERSSIQVARSRPSASRSQATEGDRFMSRDNSDSTVRPVLGWSCLAAALLVGVAIAGAEPNSAAPVASGYPADASGVTSSSAASGGLRAYQDPDTGEFIEPPPGAASAEGPPPSSFSTSGDGLAETASPVPGGGVTVEVGDRFMNAMTATVGR